MLPMQFIIRLSPTRFDAWQECVTRFNRAQKQVGGGRTTFHTQGIDDDGLMTLTVTVDTALVAFALGFEWCNCREVN